MSWNFQTREQGAFMLRENCSHPGFPFLLCVVICTPMVASGCGKDQGPRRYHVSGTIQLDGTPVLAGSVVFSPDTDKGNSGPQGTARIVDGHFDTAHRGRGTVGGPHRIHVIATNSDRPEDAELAGPLAEYTFEVDLPRETSVHNLEIPKPTPARKESENSRAAQRKGID